MRVCAAPLSPMIGGLFIAKTRFKKRMNRLKTKLSLMKLGEKENALDALWTNNNVTSGLKTKQIVDKKIKMT
jgi:hypothetical protein